MTVGVGIRPVLLDEAVTVSVWDSLVAPEEMPDKLTVCWLAPSLIVRSVSVLSVGGWLTGLTVTVKVRDMTLLLAPPSLTVTVIVADPFAEATGVKAIEPVALGLE